MSWRRGLSHQLKELLSLPRGRGVPVVNTNSVRCAFSTKQDSIMSVKEYGDISGIWHNELGSKMVITQDANGALAGEYHNTAPDSSVKFESLVGSVGKGVPATLGFVVNFEDGKYTTAWSGQYQKDDKGVEVIMTTWLMTSNLAESSLYWEMVNVGQDRFTRVKISQGELRGRKSLTAKYAE